MMSPPLDETLPRILVAEDEAIIAMQIEELLEAEGYESVGVAGSAQQAVDMARSLKPDLVLMDLGLPDMDGLDLVVELRGWSQVPIIVVSARDQEEDKVRALDGGVDDYLTKPFSSGELLARVRVALRRKARASESVSDAPMEAGQLKVDIASREVTMDGIPVHLSPAEFALLAILIKHAGKVLTHRQLLQELCGSKAATQSSNLLRVHMANLRSKLESDSARPRMFITEPGVGYRLKY